MTFDVQGLPAVDNGLLEVSVDWPATADPEAQDWDFFLAGPDGEPVGSGATLANPEVITDPRPAAGDVHPRGQQLRRRLGAVRLVRAR